MNILCAIVGALLCAGTSVLAVFVSSKRRKGTNVPEELSKLQQELDLVRSHAAEIQRTIEEEQTMSARAHQRLLLRRIKQSWINLYFPQKNGHGNLVNC